jgi:CubicO group peptidase (beta-lactamase class C family)
MRNGMSPLTCAIFMLCIPSVVHGEAQREDQVTIDGDAGRRIVDFAQRAESAGFTGAVLAAKKGRIVAAVGVGSADLDGKIPNTPSTLFEIGSATKQFTAAAALKLVEQGKLRLDESIAKQLPGVPENCRLITLRHLLQHTSGIPGTNSAGGGDDVSRVLPLFLRGGPRHSPGTHWEYWNQGYALASEIIARAAGEDYTAFCKRALFDPAGMSVSRFTGDKAPAGSTAAIGRSVHGPPRSALEHPYGSYGFQYRGMGGVVTTVRDLWRWDRVLASERVLGVDAKATLFRPGADDYALGWFVRKDARGRRVQSHGGAVRGFVCELRRYPDDDSCLFVLCNRDDVPVGQVAQAVEALLFDDRPPFKELPRPIGVELARELSGRYDDAKGALLVVESDGKVTRAIIHWNAPNGPVSRSVLGLDLQNEVVLYEWKESIKVEVARDDKGSVSQLTLVGRRFQRASQATHAPQSNP